MHSSGDQLSQTVRVLSAEFQAERRKTIRRRLKSSVLLSIPEKGLLCGDMVDIGTNGFSVIVATRLESGQGCRVGFSIPLGSQKFAIDCVGIVSHTVCVVQGFRVGMRFIVTDIREQKLIERYLAEGQYGAFNDPADKSNPAEPPVKLDAPAVVNFPEEHYPKTIRMSDLVKG